MKAHSKKSRNQRGNIYILYIAFAAGILVAWNMFTSAGLSLIVNYRSKCALEAAALAAARDLSRIVIDDPKWGYISLTDQPPIGDDTRANDGYPLPVTGINTILATARSEVIVANSIGTPEAINCAMEDLASARSAARRLTRTLRHALDERKTDDIARDINGKEVRPMQSARDLYRSNSFLMLRDMNWEAQSIKGELGSLTEESTTFTRIPGSADVACLDKSLQDSINYPAFIDVPACGEEFYFAGLGKQASLVEPSLFETYSLSNTCSIVRLTAQLKNTTGTSYMKSVACAQPAYMEDKVPTAYMVLRFPNGIPSHANTLRDLLTSQQMQKVIPLCTASGGDFPVDSGSSLKSNPDHPTATVRYAFTRAYFDWIRTAHSKPHLDSLLSSLDYRFNTRNISNTYLFTITDDGKVNVDAPHNYPFANQTTYENQLYSVAFNAINDYGLSWTIRIRDQVHRLGKQNGGKHAGQPMPSKEAVDLTQSEESRLLATAGSRYDRSRMALEFEISGPVAISEAGQ